MPPHPASYGDDLTMAIEHRDNGIVVTLSGSANTEVADKLQDELYSLIDEGARRIVLKMSDLRFLCSSTLGAIIAAHLHCRHNESDIRFVDPQPNIREMLDLTKVVMLFPVHDTIDEALAAR